MNVTTDDLKKMSGAEIFKLAQRLASLIAKNDAVVRAGERDDIVQMLCEELVYFKHDPDQLRAGHDVCQAVVGRVNGKLRGYYMTNTHNQHDDDERVESVDIAMDCDDEEVEFSKTLDDIAGLTALDKLVLAHDVASENSHCAVSSTLAEALHCSARTVRNYRAAARTKAIAFAESRGITLPPDFFDKVTEKKIEHEKTESNADHQRRMLETSSSKPLIFNGLRAFGIR